jgi:hypothetical protein
MDRSFVPSIAPCHGQNFYLVINNYGKSGTAFAETDLGEADLETVISDLMSGQYDDPVRIVAFNTAEGWSAECVRRYRAGDYTPSRSRRAGASVIDTGIRRQPSRS